MNRFLSTAHTVFSATLPAIAALLIASAPPRAPAADALEDAVSRHVAPLIEGEAVTGCVVAVILGGEQRIFAFGETAKGSGVQPDADTLYEIGSVTKALTGILLADMSLRGEVGLEDPVSARLPGEAPARRIEDEPITLLHLATHTSGLPRLPDNLAPADPANPYADYSAAQMFDFFANHALRRAPGEAEYSNYGMGLLGEVLAGTAGKTYEELVVERICLPLGMADTRIALGDGQRARLAPPYRGDLAPDRNWDFTSMAGAGAFRSTGRDMLRLCAAALGDGEEPVHQALRLALENHGRPGGSGIGLGWNIARDGTTRWHNGRTGGYSAMVYIAKPQGCAVAMLANTSTGLLDQVAERVIQTVLGSEAEPVELRMAVEVPLETLESYAGVYRIVPEFALTVTVEDGGLMVQATGQDKFPVFAETPTKFYLKVVDAQITFHLGEAGEVESLTLHQGGIDQRAVRVGGP